MQVTHLLRIDIDNQQSIIIVIVPSKCSKLRPNFKTENCFGFYINSAACCTMLQLSRTYLIEKFFENSVVITVLKTVMLNMRTSLMKKSPIQILISLAIKSSVFIICNSRWIKMYHEAVFICSTPELEGRSDFTS